MRYIYLCPPIYRYVLYIKTNTRVNECEYKIMYLIIYLDTLSYSTIRITRKY